MVAAPAQSEQREQISQSGAWARGRERARLARAGSPLGPPSGNNRREEAREARRETKEAAKLNLETRAEALRYLKEGGAIGVFPGGTVSTAAKPFGFDSEERKAVRACTCTHTVHLAP